MGGTGNVHLEITTKTPDAQKFFDQGLGQLHGFWYWESERSFRQAAMLDHEAPMPYWGLAMSNSGNEKRAREFLKEAQKLKSRASRREQLWIDALSSYYDERTKDTKQRQKDYLRGLENLIYEFPDEVEAKAFLALGLWKADSQGVSITSHLAVDALLTEVFSANPMHPAHHYRIHLWDGKRPSRALASAAMCGQSAPQIAHMWHMPGHIYSKTRRFIDAVWQQEASARADHLNMIRDRVMPYQIHNFAHNNEWMIRNQIHIGRVHDAITMAKNLIEVPRHPKQNRASDRGSCAGYGRARLFDVLTVYEMWPEVIALSQTVYLEPTDSAEEKLRRIRTLGVAYLASGDLTHGKEQIAILEEMIAADRSEAEKMAADARTKAQDAKKSESQVTKAAEDARKARAAKSRPAEDALNELQMRLALAEGRREEALILLPKVQGLDRAHQALLYLQAGNVKKAQDLARETVTANPQQVFPLAVQTEILYKTGEQKLAQEAFASLRKISAEIDLSAPVFQRLEPLARELKLPEDWRMPYQPTDVGTRPALASLGPYTWSPTTAPAWSLPDEKGKIRASTDYQSRPVVVLFYLGYGCLHCVEQLKAFAPRAQEFTDAGISVVAISTDAVDVLHKAVENSGRSEPFPFPLLSDAGLEVFRKYRVYDDFEKLPLHGTFLIDGEGRIRWQEISFDPFTDINFLLPEARRLLTPELSHPQITGDCLTPRKSAE